MTVEPRRDDRDIIIEHIHPLELRVGELSKIVEYHEKELATTKSLLESIVEKIDAHNDNSMRKIGALTTQVNRIYWLGISVAGTISVVIAFVKWVWPAIDKLIVLAG